MIEAWLFISAYAFSWPFLAILFLTGVVFEHTRCHGWAVFTGLVAMVVGYFYFDVSLKTILFWAIGYVLIGLVWSFWRYNVYVSDGVKAIKERLNSDNNYTLVQGRKDELLPSRNLDLITTWVLIWPFSAVECLLGDVITFIQTLVTKVFRQVYSRIYSSHIESLNDLK